MDVFLKGGTQRTVVYDECKDPDEVVNTALTYVGMAGYHLIWNNCYHFARYCKTGIPMPMKFQELNQKAASIAGFRPLIVGPSRCQPEISVSSFSAQMFMVMENLKNLNRSIFGRIFK